jgi:hypothetical protein
MNARLRTALAGTCLLAGASLAQAGDPPPFTARSGDALAREAAAAWSDDAHLIWIENDEALGGAGQAARWGYLFWSEQLGKGRVYSVRDGKIRVATDLSFDFPAPPLQEDWIDSDRALAVADEGKGLAYRRDHGGTVRAMTLVRGLLHPDDPDATTWAVVYESASASGLWVVVDARSGKVVKTWRG